jgi:hypothetical protein
MDQPGESSKKQKKAYVLKMISARFDAAQAVCYLRHAE